MMEPPRHKRRWFQFSLRSLLIFMLVCAIPCAWLGRKIEQKRDERRAVEALDNFGGDVQYDYDRAGVEPAGPGWLRNLLGENFFNEVEEVELADRKVTDDGLSNLKRFPHLKNLSIGSLAATRISGRGPTLSLPGPQITDAGLANLKGLTELRVLDLGGTSVTDAGLENVEGLTQLLNLGLGGTRVHDVGLDHLNPLPRLSYLLLDGTQITDAGVAKLIGLTNLRFLFLNSTRISDAGLGNLKRLTQLRQLELRNTHVSDAGVKELRSALPDCKIIH